jgi:hypothetical protein
MAGTLANQSPTASPFHSDTPSSTGYQSVSYTAFPSYSQTVSPLLSVSPSVSYSPPSPVYSQSPLASSLSFPTVSASSTHLAPVITVVQDTITISKQELIYIGVAIIIVILALSSCAYTAHTDKKKLKKLVSQYKYTTTTSKLNPANPQNHSIV